MYIKFIASFTRNCTAPILSQILQILNTHFNIILPSKIVSAATTRTYLTHVNLFVKRNN